MRSEFRLRSRTLSSHTSSPISVVLSNLGSMVDPVLYAGYGVFDLPGYQITQYGSERIAAAGIDNGTADGQFGAEAGDAYSLIALDTNVMSMVHIVLATSGTVLQSSGGEALIGAYGVVGPISFEAGWTPKNTQSGFVPLGVQYSAAMGDIALTAMFNFVYNANSGGKSHWSAGAKAVYQANYTIDAAIIQYTSAAANETYKLTGDLMVNISPTFGIVASPYFNFDSAAKDAFDTLEVFAWTTFGATKLRVGYLYMAGDVTDLNAGADYAPSANNNKGGLFATVDYNF